MENKSLVKIEDANKIDIIGDHSYQQACEFVLGIKSLRKEINKMFEPITKKAHAAWKETLAQKKVHDEPLNQAEQIIKDKIRVYNNKLETERIETERKINEKLKKEREELEEINRAKAVFDNDIQPDEIPEVIPVVIQKATPKVKGIITKVEWKYRIVNESKIKKDFFMLDEKLIAQTVKYRKKAAEELIGGIEVYEDTQIGVRG